MVAGPTGSGKTKWVYTFLQQMDYLYETPPRKIMYCYGIYQPLFEEMEQELPQLTLHRGLPTTKDIEDFAEGQHDLIVLDDLMHDVLDSKTVELMFTRDCHHRKLSVIFITQNIYGQGKSARTIALNCWYMVLFKNIRGTSQIQTLGRQLFPRKSGMLTEAFADATNVPFGYLMIDLTPRGRDDYRLRSGIFRGDDLVLYKSL